MTGKGPMGRGLREWATRKFARKSLWFVRNLQIEPNALSPSPPPLPSPSRGEGMYAVAGKINRTMLILQGNGQG